MSEQRLYRTAIRSQYVSATIDATVKAGMIGNSAVALLVFSAGAPFIFPAPIDSRDKTLSKLVAFMHVVVYVQSLLRDEVNEAVDMCMACVAPPLSVNDMLPG